MLNRLIYTSVRVCKMTGSEINVGNLVKIKFELLAAENELNSLLQGNKASSARCRAHLSSVQKLCGEQRKLCLDIVKQLPTRERGAKKTVAVPVEVPVDVPVEVPAIPPFSISRIRENTHFAFSRKCEIHHFANSRISALFAHLVATSCPL
jgi:hypothetical protein